MVSYDLVGCVHTYLDAVNTHVSLVAILLMAFLWADTSPDEREMECEGEDIETTKFTHIIIV